MKKSASSESKGLKTFFIFTGIVLFFIIISLSVKMFFIVKESKFDGRHQFILTIFKQEKKEGIVKFNPAAHEITVLKLKGESISIVPDATVDIGNNLNLDTNISNTLGKIAMNYNSVKTDLTIIDITRLLLLSYKSKVILADEELNENIFIDDAISSENVSIQIINASGVSGMGNRLERALGNLGHNIVAVTTSRNEEKSSKIQYFNEKTYTLEKLRKILDFSAEKVDKEGIADIVIIIGKDGINF